MSKLASRNGTRSASAWTRGNRTPVTAGPWSGGGGAGADPAAGVGRRAQDGRGAGQGVLDQLDQGRLGRLADPGVAGHDRGVRADDQGLADVLDGMGQDAVEAVDGDHEGQLALLEVV